MSMYACRMGFILDAFWRAAAYCLHPRVVALSILPLLLMAGVAVGVAYFWGAPMVAWLSGWLEALPLWGSAWQWLEGWGWGAAKLYVAPLLLVVGLAPVVVVLALLVVAVLATPALVSLVAVRRFPALERKQGGSFLLSLLWSLGSVLLALLALLISLPFWLIPPLVLVLPPLIWGWLTYRVMAFDALAEHASREERAELMRRYRLPLLAMGVLTGFLGAAPAVVWASGVLFAAAFLVLVPVGIWIYTLVFIFSSLWFAHYCLAGLERLRAEQGRGSMADSEPTVSDAIPLAVEGDVPQRVPPLLEGQP